MKTRSFIVLLIALSLIYSLAGCKTVPGQESSSEKTDISEAENEGGNGVYNKILNYKKGFMGSYQIYVKNTDGDPVKDVTVQFCSDELCMTADTDEKGIASFETGPGTYTVHILKVPDEYVQTEEEITVSDNGEEAGFVLEKNKSE
ncbi:MAG: hypothetical protein K6B28_13160 [Lachnospiraceae bacterium]|nr:hypothetical protein [Lachnospiraceae bacterium]